MFHIQWRGTSLYSSEIRDSWVVWATWDPSDCRLKDLRTLYLWYLHVSLLLAASWLMNGPYIYEPGSEGLEVTPCGHCLQVNVLPSDQTGWKRFCQQFSGKKKQSDQNLYFNWSQYSQTKGSHLICFLYRRLKILDFKFRFTKLN